MTDARETRDDHVRRQEAMVLDDRIVADVVAAPECHVVANLHKRLNRVVFENKTVVADGMVRQETATTTHVTHELVTKRFHLMIFLFPSFVHASVAQADKHLVLSGCVSFFNSFQRHERKLEKRISGPVFFVHCKSDDFVFTIASEVVVGHPCDDARSENYQLCHDSFTRVWSSAFRLLPGRTS